MKIRGQVVTAAAATAILFTATSGIFLSGGSRTSFADTLTPAAIAALKDALANPSSDLSSYLSQMDNDKPGSADSFKAALRDNTDTDKIKTALDKLAAADSTLQSTISSAMTSLAGSSTSLASITVALPTFTASSGGTKPSGDSTSTTDSGSKDGQKDVASNTPGTGSGPDNSLPNPAAPGGPGFGPGNGPTPGFTPFNRPGQDRPVDPGHNNPGPPNFVSPPGLQPGRNAGGGAAAG